MSDYEFDEPYVVIEQHEGSIGSFLVGLAVGAGVALLFAPRTGEELRRQMSRRARRVRDRAERVATEVGDSVTDTFQQARNEVESRIDAARRAVELKRQQVTRAVEAGRRAADEARDELERRIEQTKAAYDSGGTPGGRARTGTSGAGTPGTNGADDESA